MQTLRAGWSKVEQKIFTPPQTPFPGAQDRDGHYLYLQTQFGEDRCTKFRVIVVTDTQTHRQDRLQYTAPQLAGMQCNDYQNLFEISYQQLRDSHTQRFTNSITWMTYFAKSTNLQFNLLAFQLGKKKRTRYF